MQDYIKINDIVIRQPDEDMGYDFETTFSEDTKRTMDGTLMASPSFTVEALSYQASNVSVKEMKDILGQIMKGGFFTLHYWSPYYGEWRDDSFYVGRGSLIIGRLNEEEERYDSLSFNMIGRNAVK